jgi:hypothetical protein
MCSVAKLGDLFDHLVGEGEQGRHGQAKRHCGLEIDGELNLGRLPRGKLGWIGAMACCQTGVVLIGR